MNTPRGLTSLRLLPFGIEIDGDQRILDLGRGELIAGTADPPICAGHVSASGCLLVE